MNPTCFKLLLLNLLLFSFTEVGSQTIYCSPGASSCAGISITSVKFGSIDNASGCGGYSNYTSSVAAATINAGHFVPITVSFTAWAVVYGSGYVKAWIDFNQNGIFEDIESYNIASADANSTQTFLVRVPFDAIGGTTRMRVRIENDGFDQMIPCTVRTSGETEDYAVNIIPSGATVSNFTVYVNQTATGTNNGSTWANAFTSLSEAFAIVKGNDTVKVARGNYTPGYLLTSGVTYLGGYPNTGNPTDADRNFSLNTTVLSGQEIFGYQLQSNTMLNGFIFDNLASSAGSMAAIRLENANPLITNCVFKNNTYRVLYIIGSSPVISNCFFIDNADSYINKGIIQILNNSAPKIINCVFNKNASTSLINASGSNVTVKNCTFSNNKIIYYNIGTIVTQAEIILSGHSSATVANCIFSDDWYVTFNTYSKLTDSLNLFADNSSTFSVASSITGYNQTGTDLLRMVYPKFKDSSNAAGADNLFFTADDGLQIINPCSSAMNTGLNSAVESNADILGNQRIKSSAVDIGAYEIQTNPTAVPGTIYVNALANGLNNGTSWANAYTDLQTALAYCSDTIKVAAGNYYPSVNNIGAFFNLQNNRVILGGYPNTGNPGDNLRNPALNPTVLSGNLPVGNVKSNNVLQAVLVDSTALLDGFIIEGAGAGAVYVSYKAGPVIKNCNIKNNVTASYIYKQSNPLFVKCNVSNNDGGIQIHNSNPTIDSCSFIGNVGGTLINKNSSFSVIKNSNFLKNFSTSGADIYNDNSSPEITNCLLDSSYASSGGSIANVNNSRPVIAKCVFKNCRSDFDYNSSGGICYNKDSKPYFLNCSFINSHGNRGAIYNLNSTLKLENCLGYGNPGVCFMTNSASIISIVNSNILKSSGGGSVISNFDNSLLNITNSILWDNNFIQNTYAPEILNESSTTNISNSITRKYGTNGINGNMVGVDPRFININNPAGGDDLYGTVDDGLALCSCSPAINTAVSIATITTTDITGGPRIFNSGIDIGAYEYQSPLINNSKTFYVSSGASGANNGADWQNAYGNLQNALKNSCADTIKIMEGVYKPAINDRDSSFEINRKLHLMGGYQNSASSLEANRDPDNYPTILSGEIGNPNDTTDNSFIILKINYTDTLVKIDGLTFSDCFHDNKIGLAVQVGGALFSLNNKNLVVNNCRFSNNHSTWPFSPNSLRSISSNIDLANCVFSKNYSIDGHTVEIDGGVISNSVFSENYSVTGSNVIANGGIDFRNCIFYKNFAGGGGAGILNKGSSIVVNCDFIENKANPNGAGFKNTSGARAVLLNCIFEDNYTGNGIYADWYDYRGSPDGGSQYYQDYRYFNIVNGIVQTNFPSPGYYTPSGIEQFVNISNPIGPDNKWFTNDDGLKLLPCSPLIDAGSILTGLVLESRNVVMPVTDIMDSMRITGAGIDPGAYEYPGYFNPIVNIQATDTIICAGSPVTFTAAQTGLGSNPGFQWQVNGLNAGTDSNTFTTSLLNNNDQVKVIVTSHESCLTDTVANSSSIAIRVNQALAPSINITTGNTTICQGTSTTFTATAINSGTNSIYQWQVNGVNTGTNSNTFTTSTLNNNALVKVILTSSLSCALPATAASNTITMSVVAIPVANAGNDVSVCAGGSVQLNGSGGDTYLWLLEVSLSNVAIANPIANPSATTTYILTVSNANNCSSKDTVIVSVNKPVTPAINISIPSNNICFGSNATLTANATNGGTAPLYQWQVNGINTGANSNLFTSDDINDNDQIKAILTSNGTCITTVNATSNVIIMDVQQLEAPIVILNDKIFTIDNPDAGAIYTWQSYANGAWANIVPSATDISITVSAGGEYRVMAVKNPCIKYSQPGIAVFRTTTTSNPYRINLYPNPGSGVITLDSIKLSQNWQTLDIVNMEGQPVFQKLDINNQTMVSIDVSALRTGTYFIRLTRTDGVFTTIKFIKL